MIITNTINQFINSIIITIILIIKFKFIKIIDKIQIIKTIVNNFEFFYLQKNFYYSSTTKTSRLIREKFQNYFRLLNLIMSNLITITIKKIDFDLNAFMFLIKKKKNNYESKNSNVDNDVYYNKNLKYYNSNNSKNKNDFVIHFVILTLTFVFEYTCRCCDKTFAFNNRLHFHLCTNCFRQLFFINKLITNNYSQMFLFYFIEILITIFFIEIIKIINFNIKNFKSFIIRFNVDAFKNVNIEYDFRD